MTDVFSVMTKQDSLTYLIKGLQRLLERYLGRFDIEQSLNLMGYSSQQIACLVESEKESLYLEVVATFRRFANESGHVTAWTFTERWLGLDGVTPVTLVRLGMDYQLTPVQIAYRIEQSLRTLRRPVIRKELSVVITNQIYKMLGSPEQGEAGTFF